MTFSCDIFNGFIGGGDGEVNEAAHLLHFFFLDELEGIEVEDLGGDLAGEGGGVEPVMRPTPLLPATRPARLHRWCSQGADQADAGNDDASFWMARQINLRIP